MTQETSSSDGLEETVRRRLRALRLARGWTLDDLAARSHLSASTISRLETGHRRLTLEQLRHLAGALDVTIDSLVEPVDDSDVIIRPEKHAAPGVTVWNLSRPDGPGGVQVTKLRLTPRGPTPEKTAHPGRDWFFVLSGTVLLTLGDRELLVHQGQAAEFATLIPHSFAAHHGTAELISILDTTGQRAHLHPGH